jgi:hypothetical protein
MLVHGGGWLTYPCRRNGLDPQHTHGGSVWELALEEVDVVRLIVADLRKLGKLKKSKRGHACKPLSCDI